MYIPLPVGSIATETPENPVQSHKILQTPPKFTSQNPMRSHEQSPSNPAEIHTVIVHLVAEDSLKKETHVSQQLGPRMWKRGSWPMAEMPPEILGKPIRKASSARERRFEWENHRTKWVVVQHIMFDYRRVYKGWLNWKIIRKNGGYKHYKTISIYICWNRSKHWKITG